MSLNLNGNILMNDDVTSTGVYGTIKMFTNGLMVLWIKFLM